MTQDLLALAVELRNGEEPFALATVVRCERPTSAKPGAKALIRADGTLVGWIGGACAEPVVVREALAALRDGQPRLLALVGEGGAVSGRAEGLVSHPMTCHSGGTLEIYVEPFLPKPSLVLVGHGPVLKALADLARTADFAVAVLDPEARPEPDAESRWIERLRLDSRSSVVVATHGGADLLVLRQALAGGAGYVSLVASRKRAAMIVESLRESRLSHEQISRLKAPAGMDIGAVTPAEIAVSILAELIQHRRATKPMHASIGPADSLAAPDARVSKSEHRDPVCGMQVDAASSPYRSVLRDTTIYFCCLQCKERFDRAPGQYALVADRSPLP